MKDKRFELLNELETWGNNIPLCERGDADNYISQKDFFSKLRELKSRVTNELKTANVPTKFLLVEDGSIDTDDTEYFCEERGIKMIIYRAGATPPYIIETKPTSESSEKEVK